MNIWNFLTATTPTETVANLIDAATPIEIAAEATETAKAVLGFEPMNFVENLKYMGIGMLTIFIIIGVIILATLLINKAFSGKQEG